MHKLMPEIIATAERMDIAPHVKVSFFSNFLNNFSMIALSYNDIALQIAYDYIRITAL